MDTSQQPPASPRSVGLGATWGSAPYPVVVADPSGTVIDLNVAAAALFPGAVTGAPLRDVVPEWLADAQTRLRTDIPGPRRTGPAPAASGGVGDRTFEAHPTCTEDGDVMWWLVRGQSGVACWCGCELGRREA